jgi:hypothetical protein
MNDANFGIGTLEPRFRSSRERAASAPRERIRMKRIRVPSGFLDFTDLFVGKPVPAFAGHAPRGAKTHAKTCAQTCVKTCVKELTKY